jgi:transcriptional regulator with XRE-family HTH domain
MGTSVPIPRGELEVALGAAFRDARTAKRWTLKEMADGLGVGVNTIRWHEAGDTIMAPDKLIKAAGLLGAAPNALGASYRAAQALAALTEAATAEGLQVAVSRLPSGHNINLRKG